MTRPVAAHINLVALRHNFQRVRQSAPHSRVLAVIKANGYGHGLVRVAQALDEADAFAVARLDEALSLRAQGIAKPIVLLEGFTDREELAEIARQGIETVVHHEFQVAALEQLRCEKPVFVWLKIDTGMHRLGIAPNDTGAIWRRLQACTAVAHPLRFMTHLANADVRGDPRNDSQLETFNSALSGFAGERSIANSAAILALPKAHADWVRPGIMLYGVSPFSAGRAHDESLKPVMTLTTQLIAVNRQRQGDAIGYGGDWICPADMPVGVAAIGYGDGYPRHARPGTPVLVNGVRVPLVGRVSMDMITFDLSGCPNARVGANVVLWGEGLPVEEIAECAGTIAYHLLCSTSQRVEYRYGN
ncbi:MAG: alanine racemase [Gammaproteobacteria bacterium]